MTLAWQSPLGIESNERRSSSRPTWTKWAHAIRQREKKTNWQTLKLLCCIQLWVQFLSVSAGSRANLSTKRETIHQRESRKITLMHVQPPHGNYNAKRNESTTDKKKMMKNMSLWFIIVFAVIANTQWAPMITNAKQFHHLRVIYFSLPFDFISSQWVFSLFRMSVDLFLRRSVSSWRLGIESDFKENHIEFIRVQMIKCHLVADWLSFELCKIPAK